MAERDGVIQSVYIRWCRCLRAAGGRKLPLTFSLLLSRRIVSCLPHARIRPSCCWARVAVERPLTASTCYSTWSPSQPAVERCTQVRTQYRSTLLFSFPRVHFHFIFHFNLCFLNVIVFVFNKFNDCYMVWTVFTPQLRNGRRSIRFWRLSGTAVQLWMWTPVASHTWSLLTLTRQDRWPLPLFR